MRVVGSIVLYNNPPSMVKDAIDSFLAGESYREIVLVDHSKKDNLKDLASDKVLYFHNPKNPGYGVGHNKAFQLAQNPDYFFVLNPDIIIHKNAIEESIRVLENNRVVGIVTGKVLNPDGSLQFLLKNDPTVSALLARRISFLMRWKYFSNAVHNFVICAEVYKSEAEVPIVSGCFMGLRGEIYSLVGGFNEKYFLYFEDFDLCRRIRGLGYKIFYTPKVVITHLWKRGAHTSLRHLGYFGNSMLRYFLLK